MCSQLLRHFKVLVHDVYAYDQACAQDTQPLHQHQAYRASPEDHSRLSRAKVAQREDVACDGRGLYQGRSLETDLIGYEEEVGRRHLDVIGKAARLPASQERIVVAGRIVAEEALLAVEAGDEWDERGTPAHQTLVHAFAHRGHHSGAFVAHDHGVGAVSLDVTADIRAADRHCFDLQQHMAGSGHRLGHLFVADPRFIFQNYCIQCAVPFILCNFVSAAVCPRVIAARRSKSGISLRDTLM